MLRGLIVLAPFWLFMLRLPKVDASCESMPILFASSLTPARSSLLRFACTELECKPVHAVALADDKASRPLAAV
jgi:hypothetical protein